MKLSDLKDFCGIYSIFCFGNGKVYIGQSVNARHRLFEHFRKLKKNTHDNPNLQNSFNKYGTKNFDVYNIETCNRASLDEKEMFYIELFQSINHGFNHAKGGNKPPIKAIRKYRLANLDGKIVEGENLKEFSQTYGIKNPQSLTELLNGKLKLTQGWYNLDSEWRPTLLKIISNTGEQVSGYSAKELSKKTNLLLKSLASLFHEKNTAHSYKGWKKVA